MTIVATRAERDALRSHFGLWMGHMEEIDLSTREAALAAHADIDKRIRLFDELGWEETDDRDSFVITALSPTELRKSLLPAREDAAMGIAREERAIQECLAGDPDYLIPGKSIEETNAQSRRSINGDLALVQACDAILARLDSEEVLA